MIKLLLINHLSKISTEPVMLVIKADDKEDHLTVSPSLESSLHWLIRAALKWLGKNQYQSYYSNLSLQEQTMQWTNHNS